MDEKEHFRKTPWCRQMIDDPRWVVTKPEYRRPKPSTEDSFFAKTLATDQTINAVIGGYREPDNVDELWIHEVVQFIDVRQDVNGFPDVAHGGFMAALLDESMGFLITVNGDRRVSRGLDRATNYFTRYLNITYHVPMGTPAIIKATAKHKKIEGNKLFMHATLEDGHGKVFASADSLFLQPKAKI